MPNSNEENLIDLINLKNGGLTSEDSINKNFNENNLKSKITENSFKFIKGVDNLDYLLIVVETDNFSGGPSVFLYAYNDNLKLVTGDVSYDSCSIDKEAMSIVYGITYNETAEEPGKSGYKNNFNLTKEYNNPINVKIEGNNIYYLKADIDYGNIPADGILEERIYTIKNSKWTYKVNNKFKIIDSSGSAC